MACSGLSKVNSYLEMLSPLLAESDDYDRPLFSTTILYYASGSFVARQLRRHESSRDPGRVKTH